eukprot:TRINITY_DN18298_c0_g1_i1.p1 TRINITY_DN18298_c0_g1~~TRINITY_DN18298_c0_g1_i1.p1  ORF type:complete len:1187 (+),score=271.13 TRINITY_DN18298_c0_g1_i1:100-3660(+)
MVAKWGGVAGARRPNKYRRRPCELLYRPSAEAALNASLSPSCAEYLGSPKEAPRPGHKKWQSAKQAKQDEASRWENLLLSVGDALPKTPFESELAGSPIAEGSHSVSRTEDSVSRSRTEDSYSLSSPWDGSRSKSSYTRSYSQSDEKSSEAYRDMSTSRQETVTPSSVTATDADRSFSRPSPVASPESLGLKTHAASPDPARKRSPRDVRSRMLKEYPRKFPIWEPKRVQLWEPRPPGQRPEPSPFTQAIGATPFEMPMKPLLPAASPATPSSPSRPVSPGTAKARLGMAPVLLPEILQDEPLSAIARRLTKALVQLDKSSGRKRFVGITHAERWSAFLAERDKQGRQRLSVADCEALFCESLGAKLSRYEVRVLHRRLDLDSTGFVSHRNLLLLMYRVDLATWPELSPREVGRIVARITEVAERWHRLGGNWFTIFQQTGAGNKICFRDFRDCIRKRFPGLHLSEQELSDHSLCGLWRAYDVAADMETPVQHFMAFLRRQYPKATKAPKGPGLSQAELAQLPALDEEGLRGVATKLCAGLKGHLAKYGFGSGNSAVCESSPKIWQRLWEFTCAIDTRTRITFGELQGIAQRTFKVTIPEDELKAFWHFVDVEWVGEVSLRELGNGIYRLLLRGWPDLEDAEIDRVVVILNVHSEKWHHSAGNWFKVFMTCDEDRSGDLEFEEFNNVVRKSYPGLCIRKSTLDDRLVRGFWKALDADESGTITVQEFMLFMRHHGGDLGLHRVPACFSNKKRASRQHCVHQELGPPPTRSDEELAFIAMQLEKALLRYLGCCGVRCGLADNKWDLLFHGHDLRLTDARHSARHAPKTNFAGFEKVLRQVSVLLKKMKDGDEVRGAGRGIPVLNLEDKELKEPLQDHSVLFPEVTYGDVRALWAVVDRSETGTGGVTAADFKRALYRLEVLTWPEVADPGLLERCVTMISNHAAHVAHKCGSNWYKVFRLFDEDESGRICFDEFREIVRRSNPCLNISKKALPERDLRALWKAMDSDLSGEITVSEFMIFMRRNGAKYVEHRPYASLPKAKAPDASGKACGNVGAADIAKLSAGGILGEKQASMLRDSLSNESTESLQSAYEAWGLPWTGTVSEWDWLQVVRRLLGLPAHQLDDDAVHAVWTTLDEERQGEVEVGRLLELGWEQASIEKPPKSEPCGGAGRPTSSSSSSSAKQESCL